MVWYQCISLWLVALIILLHIFICTAAESSQLLHLFVSPSNFASVQSLEADGGHGYLNRMSTGTDSDAQQFLTGDDVRDISQAAATEFGPSPSNAESYLADLRGQVCEIERVETQVRGSTGTGALCRTTRTVEKCLSKALAYMYVNYISL